MRVILANMELSSSVFSREDRPGRAVRHSTAKLSRSPPDHLGEMGVLWVVAVVVLHLAVPPIGGGTRGGATGRGVEVFSIGTDGTSRVLELAAIRPFLGSFCEGVAPLQGNGVMPGANIVVAREVLSPLSIGGNTALEGRGESERSEGKHGSEGGGGEVDHGGWIGD